MVRRAQVPTTRSPSCRQAMSANDASLRDDCRRAFKQRSDDRSCHSDSLHNHFNVQLHCAPKINKYNCKRTAAALVKTSGSRCSVIVALCAAALWLCAGTCASVCVYRWLLHCGVCGGCSQCRYMAGYRMVHVHNCKHTQCKTCITTNV